MADRAWISTFIDFNKDGFFDTIAIAKEVFAKEKIQLNLSIEVGETVMILLICTCLKIKMMKNLKNIRF